MSEVMKDANGYEIRPLSIKLFENSKKTKDNHPDYTGKMYDENGKEFFVSCWLQETKKGNSFLSGQITDADEARAKWSKEKSEKNEKLPEKKEVGADHDEKLPF